MFHKVNDTARVTVFVIVPGDELNEVRVQHDTGIGIEDGGTKVTLEVSGDKRLVAVSKESLHLALRQGLDVGADLFVGGGLLKTAGKIDDGNVNGWDTESHTGELALEGRNDLGDGLGGSSGGWNDVARSGTSSTPVLSGRGVDNSLGGGHGVHSGHECLLNDVLVVDGLDHRGKSVGGAGCARDEVLRSVVFLLVDTHDNGLGVILGRGGVDDLLGTTIDDGLGGVLGKEDSSGLTDVVSTKGTPANFLRVTASGSEDLFSVENKEVAVNLDSLLGLSVDGIVLVLVGHVVWGGRSGIDSLEGNISILHHDTSHCQQREEVRS